MKKREEHIGYQVRTLSNLIRRNAERDENELLNELTPMQRWIIGFVCDAENDVFQRDIEKEFDIRRSTATTILQLMEKRGLIIREPTDYDARLKKIVLTEKSLEIERQVRENISSYEKKMRENISDEEIDHFFALIERIKQNLR